MRAAVVEGYGGVERLQVKELEPLGEPGTGEVRASSVNPLDSKIRMGQLPEEVPDVSREVGRNLGGRCD